MIGAGRGRTPLPSNVREMRGNPGKRPLPQAEPRVAVDRPKKPAGLSKIAGEEWERLAEEAESMRVLSRYDRGILEVTARAYGEYRAACAVIDKKGKNGGSTYTSTSALGYKTPRTRPEVHIRNDAWRRYVLGLIHFGLTPVSRSKVETLPPGTGPGGTSKLQRFRDGA